MKERELYRELGRAIGTRRKRLGLTQERAAKAAGMSRASLANMEVGRQNILVHQLYRLASVLNLDSPAKLLPIGTLDHAVEADDLTISEIDLSARQRAQVAEVYRLVGSVKRTDGQA